MTRAVLESMKLDSKVELKHLKVDGGMTNGDMVMSILADYGGFTVIRPEMRECVLSSLLMHWHRYLPPPCTQVHRTRLCAPRRVRHPALWVGHRQGGDHEGGQHRRRHRVQPRDAG